MFSTTFSWSARGSSQAVYHIISRHENERKVSDLVNTQAKIEDIQEQPRLNIIVIYRKRLELLERKEDG